MVQSFAELNPLTRVKAKLLALTTFRARPTFIYMDVMYAGNAGAITCIVGHCKMRIPKKRAHREVSPFLE